MQALTPKRFAPLIAILGAAALLLGCGDSASGPHDELPEFTQAEYYPIGLGRAWRYVLFEEVPAGVRVTVATRIAEQTPDGARQAVTRCWYEGEGSCATESVSPDSVMESGNPFPDRLKFRFPMRSGDRWVVRDVPAGSGGGGRLDAWREIAAVTWLDSLVLRTGATYAGVLRVDESRIDFPSGAPPETTLTDTRYLARDVGLVCTRSYASNGRLMVSLELLGHATGEASTSPGAVGGFSAIARGTQVRLRWTNPADSDFEGVSIRYAKDDCPARLEDGRPVANGNRGRFAGPPSMDDSCLVSGLEPGTAYGFSAFAYDHALEYAIPVCASVTTGTPPPPDFLPRTSPENLLRNLIAAYRLRKVAEYESLLAQDFTFIVAPEDQQKPDMPDAWGRMEEVHLHTGMFDADLVRTLALDYDIGPAIWDAEEGKYSVVVRGVDLYLYGTTPGHPTEAHEFRVSDNRSKFWFRRNGWFWPGTRDSVWTIALWADSPLGSREPPGAAQEISWGAVKALFE